MQKLRLLGVPGICLVAAGIGLTVVPFVFLGLGNYKFVGIAIAGVLVGPYFLSLGYLILWGAFSDAEPPYLQQVRKFLGWYVRTMTRKL